MGEVPESYASFLPDRYKYPRPVPRQAGRSLGGLPGGGRDAPQISPGTGAAVMVCGGSFRVRSTTRGVNRCSHTALIIDRVRLVFMHHYAGPGDSVTP